jgi:hypothetical protein
MRALILGFLAFAAACSPPAAQQQQPQQQTQNDPLGPAVPEPNAEQAAMTAALADAAAPDIGQPVRFTASVMRVRDEWGWLVAQPWTPEGAAIDWSRTNYAQRARDGVLDGNGTTYALLKNENGHWRVLAFAIGPTDVAWADWPQRYGAPADLMQVDGGK